MAPDKATASKAGSLKDPDIASLFFNIDPEKLFDDLREIGHGSFGAVYYARNVDTNEVVAIKKMSYSGKQSLEKWQDIIKEVKFLTQIKHPNTVDYKGCYLKEHTAWLVMEYCIGSASDLVEVHKNSLKEDEIAGIIHDAMQGLHYLHLHDKIHRDVKAGNILLTDGGHVKLADFGSASIVSPANSFVGTPYWMAPEVILAMDEGQYSGKADIWSMGITCIELAERKPPLFNMNAMSALYHIAQNDPPTLSESLPDGDKEVPTNWSQDFIKFVSLLLQKIPEDRPTSDGVLQHTFLTKERSPTCVLDLIERTKNVVRDLDNLQYRKMKKILMAENRVKDSPPSQQHPISSTAASQKADTTDDDMDSVSCTDSIASNPSSFISVASSSKSSSISSLNESRVSDSGSLNSQDGTTAAISEEQGASSSAATATIDNRPQRSYSPSGGRTTSPIVTRQQQESQLARIAGIQSPGARSRLKPQMQQKTQRERQSDVYNFRNSLTPESIKRRDELMKNDSGFATIRSAQVVHRQMYEHNEDNRHREQMLGYKRMRQQHQKQLINFEQKLKNEMDEYSVKLVKELESTRSAFAQELDRLVRKHQQELEKEAKQQQGDDKKYQKHIGQMQDQEIKGFLQQQKKDYKGKKEQLKEDSNQMQGNKEARDEWLTRQINTLVTMHSQAENQLRERYNQTLELEVRKYRRKALLSRHNLEQDLLREELNLKQQHKDKEHEMLLRQHDATQSLEYKHLHAIHTQRIEHLKSQHQTELSNQMEYSQRRESELKRKHLAAIRQQPKSLKVSGASDKSASSRRSNFLSGGSSAVKKKSTRKQDNKKESKMSPSKSSKFSDCVDVCNDMMCELCGLASLLNMVDCLREDDLFSIYNILSNLICLNDLLIDFQLDDEFEEASKNFKENGRTHEENEFTESSSYSMTDAINITEEELMQLAAETQDEEEQKNLCVGLNTMRKGGQEEVVLRLRSKLLFSKSNLDDAEVDLHADDTSDEDMGLDEDSDTLDSIPESLTSPTVSEAAEDSDTLDLLPPELCKTYPGIKMPSPEEVVTERSRSRSGVADSRQKEPKSPEKPQKSKSFPDVTKGHLKENKPKKSSKLKPWIPSGSSGSLSMADSSKDLRQKVLTRAAEWSRNSAGLNTGAGKTSSKRNISKNILERTKIFSGSSNIATVIRRMSPAKPKKSQDERPPWRPTTTSTPVKPLPTIKPFVMRKATRKHELGLNRSELQNLKFGLHKVLDHEQGSCQSKPYRSQSLNNSSFGRVASSKALNAQPAQTFASSNEPQTDYQGCEVCRLKEAMRSSPMGHKLKQTPHHCADTTKTITPAENIPNLLNPRKSFTLTRPRSYLKSDGTVTLEQSRRSSEFDDTPDGMSTFYLKKPMKKFLFAVMFLMFLLSLIYITVYHPFYLIPYIGICSTAAVQIIESDFFKRLSSGEMDKVFFIKYHSAVSKWKSLSVQEKFSMLVSAVKKSYANVRNTDWKEFAQSSWQHLQDLDESASNIPFCIGNSLKIWIGLISRGGKHIISKFSSMGSSENIILKLFAIVLLFMILFIFYFFPKYTVIGATIICTLIPCFTSILNH
ncbi:uncharacterized protein LOC120341823 isoform X1 [Styela clava]